MAYRQPRVPEYSEQDGAGKTLRALILFLKDFSMAAWTANNQRKREIEAISAGGNKGAAGEAAFHIDEDGHLICTYSGDAPPPLHIDADGHLIYTYQAGG